MFAILSAEMLSLAALAVNIPAPFESPTKKLKQCAENNEVCLELAQLMACLRDPSVLGSGREGGMWQLALCCDAAVPHQCCAADSMCRGVSGAPGSIAGYPECSVSAHSECHADCTNRPELSSAPDAGRN